MNKPQKTAPRGAAPETPAKVLSRADQIAQINKKFGPTAIATLASRPEVSVRSVSTGLAEVDVSTGCGGLPVGNVVEIFGAESSNKTTFAGHAIASYQQQGMECHYADVEHKLDPQMFTRLGVDNSRLGFTQPSSAEELTDLLLELATTRLYQLLIIDTIAEMSPDEEQDEVRGRSSAGMARAQLLSRFIRAIRPELTKNQITLLCLNQTRSGQNGEYQPGGNAIRYAAPLRGRMSPWFADGKRLGSRLTWVKNQVGGAPYTTLEIPYHPDMGYGFDAAISAIRVASAQGIIEQRGAHYYWKGEKVGVGIANVREWYVANPLAAAEITRLTDESLRWHR